MPEGLSSPRRKGKQKKLNRTKSFHTKLQQNKALQRQCAQCTLSLDAAHQAWKSRGRYQYFEENIKVPISDHIRGQLGPCHLGQ